MILATWIKDDEATVLVDTLKSLDVNWNINNVVMHYKDSGLHATLSNFFITTKEGQIAEVPVWPCYQYFLPIEDALNYELRYISIELVRFSL